MNLYDKIINNLRNNKYVVVLILIGTVVISISAFTDALTKLRSVASPLSSLLAPGPVDITGAWLSEKSDDLGYIYFHFDSQEDRLFGKTIQTTSSRWPFATTGIQDGKIDGNNISFLVARSFVKRDRQLDPQSRQWSSPEMGEVVYRFEGDLENDNTIHFIRSTKTGYAKLVAKRIVDRTRLRLDDPATGTSERPQARPYSFVYSLPGHKGGVNSLAFCPGGRYPIVLATGGVELLSGGAEDGKIRHWDTATAKNRGAAELSDGGEVHVACSRRADLPQGVLAKTFFAVNGDMERHNVITREVSDFESHAATSHGHGELSGTLESIIISGTMALLFATSELDNDRSHALRLRYSSGEIVKTLTTGSFIGPMAMSLDSTVLSFVSRNTAGEFFVDTRYFQRGTEIGRWQTPPAPSSPKALALDPDGLWLAVSSGETSHVSIWDLRKQTLFKKLLIVESAALCCLAFAKEGKILVGAETEGRRLSIWRVSEGDLYQTIETEGPVDSIAISQDARLIAAGDRDTGEIHLWARIMVRL